MMVDISTPKTREQIYTINYWSINLAFLLGSLVGGFAFGAFFFQLLLGAAVLVSVIALITLVAISETAPSDRTGTARDPRAREQAQVAAGRLHDGAARQRPGPPGPVRPADPQRRDPDLVLHRRTPQHGLRAAAVAELRAVAADRRRCRDARHPAGGEHPHRGLSGTVRRVAVRPASSDRQRIFGGIVLFTAGYMVWGASNAPWLLLAAAVVLTVGEIMSVPIRQVLLADLVPADDRSRYMAVYQINVQLGMVVASLCLALGVLIPAVGMSLLFGLFGVGALLIYWSLFRERDARAAVPQPAAVQENTQQT